MTTQSQPIEPEVGSRELASLVFVAFNSKIAALDRDTGDLVWSWKCPKGSGIVAILLDGDRLIAAVQGYTYCLDPLSGRQIWANPLTGMGIGATCLASARGNASPQLYAVLAAYQQQQQAEATSQSGVAGSF